MSNFEFIFSLLGLLLGLALAEVLAGMNRTLKARAHVKIGWLTPLLGLYVCMDLVSFWESAWQLREKLQPHLYHLYGAAVIIGVYYLVAGQVFPHSPQDWRDLDIYYQRHKRLVLLGVLFCNQATLGAGQLLGVPAYPNLGSTLQVAAIVACLLTACFVRNTAVNVAMLIAMMVLYILPLPFIGG